MNKIELTLRVPSVEQTGGWYQSVVGWTSNFDVFDPQGRYLFEGTPTADAGTSNHDFVGFNFVRYGEGTESYKAGKANCSLWIFVDDVDDLYRRIIAHGAKPESAPEDEPWGGRSFRMEDINGLKLVFVEILL